MGWNYCAWWYKILQNSFMADISYILWVKKLAVIDQIWHTWFILPSQFFDGFQSNHHHWMDWLGATIVFDGCRMVLGSPIILSRWFSMVVHHHSNDAMWWSIVPVYPETISLRFLLQSLQVEGRKYIFFAKSKKLQMLPLLTFFASRVVGTTPQVQWEA